MPNNAVLMLIVEVKHVQMHQAPSVQMLTLTMVVVQVAGQNADMAQEQVVQVDMSVYTGIASYLVEGVGVEEVGVARGIGVRAIPTAGVGAVIPIKIIAQIAQALFAPQTPLLALQGQQEARRLRGRSA